MMCFSYIVLACAVVDTLSFRLLKKNGKVQAAAAVQEHAEANATETSSFMNYGDMVMVKLASGNFPNSYAAQASCTADPLCVGILLESANYYGPWKKAVLGGNQVIQGYKKNFYFFFKVPLVNDPFLFVIDKSGSMKWASNTPGVSRDTASIRELTRAMNGLTPYQRFNVLTFDSGSRKAFSDVQYATAANLMKALQFAMGSPGSGTNTYAALSTALQMPTSPRKIYLLSDGEPNRVSGHSNRTKAILDRVTALDAGRRIPIMTILIGSKGADFMQALAAHTGGVYQAADV